MSALGEIVDAAVASVIAEHPNLFNPQGKTRAHKTLSREIMKALTGKRPGDGGDQPAQVTDDKPGELIAADDPRAIAYANLRQVAGAIPAQRINGQIWLPRQGDSTAVATFSDLPPRWAWEFYSDHRQLTAWAEFFAATLPSVARRETRVTRDGVTGLELPWPWPPSKTGKIYEPGSTEPVSA
jgi:hypothetical protein